jgi:hypothetical protein
VIEKKVFINGVEYRNVANITPEVVTDYYYDVITLDGKLHVKKKGKRTNYNVVFYNDLSGNFYKLMQTLSGDTQVLLSVPINDTDFEESLYAPQIIDFALGGYLGNGKFYHNGLEVSFKKVDYDE